MRTKKVGPSSAPTARVGRTFTFVRPSGRVKYFDPNFFQIVYISHPNRMQISDPNTLGFGSTSHRPRPRYPAANTDPIQTPQSHVTASVDGLVGYISSELVVLACPRLIRCLYCYKDFRCLTKSIGYAAAYGYAYGSM